MDVPGLVREPVVMEPRVAVLPADPVPANHESLDIGQLVDEPWVVSANRDPAYQRFAPALGSRGGRPPILGPTVHTIDEYLEVVLAHRAIGLAPSSAARYYARPGITYVPVPDAAPSVCTLSWSARYEMGEAARSMVDLVRSQSFPR